MRLPQFLETKNFEVFSGFLGFMENPIGKTSMPQRGNVPLLATWIFIFHDPF